MLNQTLQLGKQVYRAQNGCCLMVSHCLLYALGHFQYIMLCSKASTSAASGIQPPLVLAEGLLRVGVEGALPVSGMDDAKLCQDKAALVSPPPQEYNVLIIAWRVDPHYAGYALTGGEHRNAKTQSNLQNEHDS